MNLYFFDTETTGIDAEAKIIQFCGKKHGEQPYTELFNPHRSIDIGALATHHITLKMLEGKEKFEDFIPFLDKISLDHIFVAHNAKFDIDRIVFEGAQAPKFYIDTLKVARYVLQHKEIEPESYGLQYLRYFYGLDEKDNFAGITGGKKIVPHDAESDVFILEALFFQLLDEIGKGEEVFNVKPVLTQMINISKNPITLRRMPFGKHKGIEFKDVETSYLSWLLGEFRKTGGEFSDDLIHTVNAEMKKRNQR